MDLTIHNALHDRTLKLISVGIQDGKIQIITDGDIEPGTRAIDAENAMLSPALVEPHFHLENAVLPEYVNQSGTLGEAIKIAEEIKDQLSDADILRRSTIALRQAIFHGEQWMRDHTDVDQVAGLSLFNAVKNVRDVFQNVIDIEIVAFPQFGLADNPESVDLVLEAMEQGADLVGGVPHREKNMDKAARQIELAFQIAIQNDADIDMHVDETDDPYWHTLELLAEKTIETGYQGRVTAGHCCAMAAWNEKLFQRILPKVVDAKINICTNTPVNLVIQGREDELPMRRGIARVKDLLAAGVNVTCGQDDLQNMFYPFGNMDGLAVANFVAHAAHLNSGSLIQDAFDMPRYNAATALNLENYGLFAGARANLILLKADSAVDAIRRQPPRTYVIRDGVVLVKNEQKLTLSPCLPEVAG